MQIYIFTLNKTRKIIDQPNKISNEKLELYDIVTQKNLH